MLVINAGKVLHPHDNGYVVIPGTPVLYVLQFKVP